jgi:hypothetical protein
LPVRRCVAVARTNLHDVVASELHEADGFDHVEGLTLSWKCQAVRAPGVKCTAPTLSCEVSLGSTRKSTKTSPVIHASGPLMVGLALSRSYGSGVAEWDCRCSERRLKWSEHL